MQTSIDTLVAPPSGRVRLGAWMLVLSGVFAMLSGCSTTATPPAATQVALTVSAASVTLGGSLGVSATLTGGNASAIGVITFYDGSTQLQAVKIAADMASATITGLTPGVHSITAAYGGDQQHAVSTSAAASVSVQAPTTTTLMASPQIAAVGDPVTLTATVAAGTYTPTGVVTFATGTTALGSATLSGNTAMLVTTGLPLGNDPVVASYAAQGSFLGSTSSPVIVQVHAALIKTTTSLTATSNGTIAAGTSVTFTATLTPASTGSAAPTGSYTFYENGSALATVPLNGLTASFTTKQFVTGTNAITAMYSGDAVYATSTSAPVTLTLTAYTGATYTNPLSLNDPTTGKVYNCPDPAIIKSQAGTTDTWYAYCTGDAFNAADTVAGGGFKQHLISIFQSSDLVHWTYVRDAFAALPAWVASNNELQTPAIKFFGGLYHLYYEAPAVTASPNGSAIGVGTAVTAAGPFLDSGGPVINQQTACGNACNRTVFAPEVLADQTGQMWIAYGGIYAGLSIRKLNALGTVSDPNSEINIAVDNYYTNPFLTFRNGYFYEFATPAGACCSGAFSTYSVRVGRSTSITGPYLDAEGNDMNAFSTAATQAAPGGDTVLVNTGNDIVGPGSNVVFTDEAGQDFILYSGVSKQQQYLPNVTGYTARQLMMDPLDWVNGWPLVRNGAGPSDFTTPQPVPAAQPGATDGYVPVAQMPDVPGTLIAASSDEFNSKTLSSQWTFLHTPANYTLTGTAYSVPSNYAESTVATGTYGMSNLPILAEPEPAGNYLLEVKVASTVPATGCCGFNYSQQGVFIYSTDTNYLRLDEYADFDTRQIEFLDQFGTSPANSFAPVGTPNYAANTWLRIAKRVGTNGAPDTYTSYSSIDGVTFVRGPAWTASYGSTARIGLFSGNLGPFAGIFDYVRVYTLKP